MVSARDPEGREVRLAPGTLALARPGTIDAYRWEDRSSSTHAYVHFEVENSVRLPPPTTWPLTRPFDGHDPLRPLCGYLLDLASTGGSAERARSDQVVGLLLDLFLTGPFPRLAADQKIPVRLNPALARVQLLWETRGVGPVPVPELAAAAGMSSGHFSRMFGATFGCGPATGLELVRLGRAATALQRTNLSLAAVARHHGFADAYHLSKRFARVYGMPPGRFRTRGEDVDPLGPLAVRDLMALWARLATAT